jgi:hypothetical protein
MKKKSLPELREILERQEHLLANKQLVAKLPDRYSSCHFILKQQEHLVANNQLVAKLPDKCVQVMPFT